MVRASSQTVSLNDTAVVTNVLQGALNAGGLGTTSHSDVERVAQAITSVNTQLLATSGTTQEAVAATRYAQSQLQDLMTQIGETAAGSEESIDLTRLDEEVTEAITRTIESPVDIISQSQATTLEPGQRVEDQAFAFALRPAVVLVNAQAAAIQSISVDFDIAGIELKRTSSTGAVIETIAPGTDGAFLISYDELDKIRVVPPAHFNGRIPLTVTITYAGVGARPAESLHIDVAPVNDAPVAAGSFAATLGTSLSGAAGALFSTAFSDASDDQQSTGGSAPNTLAGFAIVANAATPAQGTWQFSSNEGQTWANLPAVSVNAAVLIGATDRVRFQPAAGFGGAQPGALTAYLVDSSGGTVTSGSTVSVPDSARGGASRYSAGSVTLSAGAIVSLTASAGVGSTINAVTLAAGVPVTVSLADSAASAGDRIEIRLGSNAFVPPLFKVLTALDIAHGSVTFTIPSSGFGTDGAKSIGAELTYSNSGVVITSTPLELLVDTVSPSAPGLSLTAASDTGVSSSDRITSDSSAVLRIALPNTGSAAVAGDAVRLLSGASALADVKLTAPDVQAGFVNVRASGLADGIHSFTARLVDAAGNVSVASAATGFALDTAAPTGVTLAAANAPVTIDANDARSHVITGDGAEVGSTVEIQVTRTPAAPLVYRATPDLLGHFATAVDLGAGGSDAVTLVARAVDAAGNVSVATSAQLTVVAAATPNSIVGTAQTDELVSGTSFADIFVAGAGSGQDYFIGAGSFDVVRVNGAQADYVLSFVPDAQRAAHQALLSSSATLQSGTPLVRLAGRGAANGEVMFFQAEAVEFSDGTARITSQEMVSASGSGQSFTGGAGNDRLFAASGGQRLVSGAGDDILVGGIGPDTLISSGRSSATTGRTLVGGDGDDTFQISGDAASSGSRVVARGGAGRDRFQLLPAEGFDLAIVIADMRPGEDRIDLSALRVRQGTTLRTLTAADLDLPALSAALASPTHAAEIDLSRFSTANGMPMSGTLRIELSAYGAPVLEATDVIAVGS
jgi:Ca2+-binding RTX toxin-like protein